MRAINPEKLRKLVVGSNYLTVSQSTGYVGVGTASPLRAFHFSNNACELLLTDADYTTNLKTWRIRNASGALYIESTNDAITSATTVLTIGRSGGLTVNGGLTLSNTFTLDATGAGGYKVSFESGGAALNFYRDAANYIRAITAGGTIAFQTNGDVSTNRLAIGTAGVSVTGTFTVSSTIGVTGAATFSNTVTVNGALLLVGSSGAAVAQVVEVRSAAGYSRYFQVRTGTSGRWAFGANSTAESGSDAGSDFFINRSLDAGTTYTQLTITRSSGLATWGQAGSARGRVRCVQGASTNTPGTFEIADTSGAIWYLFVDTSGKLRIHNALPTSNSDGTVIGTQT